MTTFEVYDPTGAVVTARFHHAPRVPDLNGKTVCELSNGLWQDHRTFPLIRRLLREKFPDINIVPYTEFPAKLTEIDIDGIAQVVSGKGCHAVIGGNAG
ncbi:MAG: hypothetical protein HYX90_11125 [Chloroflexi bacterium]|nr:hypothetical protein [Chloroflexota bacterium]